MKRHLIVWVGEDDWLNSPQAPNQYIPVFRTDPMTWMQAGTLVTAIPFRLRSRDLGTSKTRKFLLFDWMKESDEYAPDLMEYLQGCEDRVFECNDVLNRDGEPWADILAVIRDTQASILRKSQANAKPTEARPESEEQQLPWIVEAYDRKADGFVWFDTTYGTHWGPACYGDDWDPINEWFTFFNEEYLFWYDRSWTLLCKRTSFEARRTVWITTRLTSAEALDWFVRSGIDPPRNLRTGTAAGSVGTDDVTPKWNEDRRELSLNGTLCKRFRQKAKHQTRILAVFEEEGWPRKIDDPLPGGTGDPKRRLSDAVRGLNNKCSGIRFELDGTGEGIIWEAVRPDDASARGETPF